MGMPQPGSPETSENAVSEGHDRSQRTSMESPKAAQPSCLRGGFICLFLKRTEPDRSLEDASSSNQSTEDKHGVRGKKRKVLSGNIFRLPCLRPAERTETGEQINAQVNKVDEQGNQAIPEEELKPYSKASFLRKIRGYRLMRERDATEKEKVIEMEQCKEGLFVEEHHEKKIDLSGKVTQPKIYGDILGEKEKMSEEKESEEMTKGEKGSKVLQQERKVEFSADQGNREINDKNLRDPEKTVDEKDNGGMNIGVKRNGMAEYKNPTDNVEELGNDLKEQENHAGKANGHNDKDMLGQENHKEIVEDLGNKITKQEQTEGIPEPGDSITNLAINSKKVHELDNYLQEHNPFIHTKKADDVANDLPENGVIMENAEKLENEKCHKHKDGKAEDHLLEEDSHKHKDGKAEDRFLEEDCHKHKDGKAEDHLLEEDSHIHKDAKAEDQLLEEDCHKHKDGKAEDHFLEEDCHKHNDRKAEVQFPEEECHKHKNGKVEDQLLEEDCHKQKDGKSEDQFLEKGNHITKKGKAGDQLLEQDGYLQKGGHCLLEQNSNTENTRKPDTPCLEQEGQGNNLRKTKAQITEQDSLEDGNLPKKNKRVKKHKGLGKVVSEEIKDRSVKQEIVITHTMCTARSEEPHAEFSTFQEESAPNTVDFNYHHQEGNQEDINDGEDDVMEDEEWKSLQVEVKSMVQWLVEEASDRLESFSQESQGTE